MEDISTKDPFNLVSAICGGVGTDFCLSGLEKALATLDGCEKEVLIGRYANNITLEAIGKNLNVTRERVWQIEQKALCKLGRHPRLAMIRCVPLAEHEKTVRQLQNAKKQFDRFFSVMEAFGAEAARMEDVEVTVCSRIEERNICYLDISTRAVNCLYRHGVNTVSDLTSLTKRQLGSIRSMGRKTVREVTEWLDANGLSLSGM